MGIKEIFSDGVNELKRKKAILDIRKKIRNKEKIFSGQLMLLGKKAWESKVDISSFEKLNTSLKGIQDEFTNNLNLQSELEKTNQSKENEKISENDKFAKKLKIVMDKKLPIDNELLEEKKILQENQGKTGLIQKRFKKIPQEEESLQIKLSNAEITAEEQSATMEKIEILKNEREKLKSELSGLSLISEEISKKLQPLEDSSALYQKEINKISDEKNTVIGELDKIISKTKNEMAELKPKQNELNLKRNENFRELGKAISGTNNSDTNISSELLEVKNSQNEINSLTAEKEKLEKIGENSKSNPLLKMTGIIFGAIITIALIIFIFSLITGEGTNSPKSILKEFISIQKVLLQDLNNINDADSLAKALSKYHDRLETVLLKARKLPEAQTQFKNEFIALTLKRLSDSYITGFDKQSNEIRELRDKFMTSVRKHIENYENDKKIKIVIERFDELEKKYGTDPGVKKLKIKENMSSSEQNEKQIRTLGDLKSIGTKFEMYRTMAGEFPDFSGTFEEAYQKFPDFAKHTGKKEIIKDGWGNDFIIKTSSKNWSYFIGSAGKDGKFNGWNQSGTYTASDYNQDLIYSDGGYVYFPK